MPSPVVKVKLVFNAKRLDGSNVFNGDILAEAPTRTAAESAISAAIQVKLEATQTGAQEILDAQNLFNS